MSFDGLWILSSLGGGNILISLPDSLFSNIVIENENGLTFHCQSHRNCFFIAVFSYGMADPNTNPGTQRITVKDRLNQHNPLQTFEANLKIFMTVFNERL